jgi:hypothetical protein
MKKRLTWQERVALDKLPEVIADELLSDVLQRIVAAYGTHSGVTQTAHRALATINDLRRELRRKIVRFDVTRHPTAGWLSNQVTEAFPWDTAPRYLLRDRDTSYGSEFCNRVEAMGIGEVITSPRSPWQNAYVERVIGVDSP